MMTMVQHPGGGSLIIPPPPPPRMGPPTPVAQYLDYPVMVTLVTGEMVHGTLFCVDLQSSNTIVLRQVSTDGQSADIRIIKFQQIREIAVKGGREMPAVLPPCTTSVLEERERNAIAAFEAQRHTIGVGVTAEAQEIFNFIHKTHPDCRWLPHNRIGIMNVTVNPPYNAENCEGSGQQLARIQSVIERYRDRQRRDQMNNPPRQEEYVPPPPPPPPQQVLMLPPGVEMHPPAHSQQLAYMVATPEGYLPPQGMVMVMVQPPPPPPPQDGSGMSVAPPPYYAPVLLAPHMMAPASGTPASSATNTPNSGDPQQQQPQQQPQPQPQQPTPGVAQMQVIGAAGPPTLAAVSLPPPPPPPPAQSGQPSGVYEGTMGTTESSGKATPSENRWKMNHSNDDESVGWSRAGGMKGGRNGGGGGRRGTTRRGRDDRGQ